MSCRASGSSLGSLHVAHGRLLHSPKYAVIMSNEHGSAAQTASKLGASGTLPKKAKVGKSLKICFAVHA